MNQNWTNLIETGPELLPRTGAKLDQRWLINWLELDLNWTRSGPDLEQIWTRTWSELDQNRAGPDQSWIRTRPEHDQNWTRIQLERKASFQDPVEFENRIYKSFPFCLILLANRFVFLAIFFIGLIVFRILLIENRN